MLHPYPTTATATNSDPAALLLPPLLTPLLLLLLPPLLTPLLLLLPPLSDPVAAATATTSDPAVAAAAAVAASTGHRIPAAPHGSAVPGASIHQDQRGAGDVEEQVQLLRAHGGRWVMAGGGGHMRACVRVWVATTQTAPS